MMRQLYILPAAEEDALDAQTWYELEQPGLGYRFAAVLVDAYEFLLQHPFAAQIHSGEIRRKVIHEFQFSIYYIVDPEEIGILAVWHQHRNPADLNDRLAPFA